LIHDPAIEEPLSDEEVREQAWLTILSGAGASTHWIANTMEELLRDRRIRVSLESGVLTVAAAMRRALWENPPIQNVMGRWPLYDVRLGQVTVRAGDMVVLGLAAANTDPALSENTDRTSFSFSNDSHMAWGAGSHRCPAQGLAEVITTTAVERLLEACPGVHLSAPDQPLDWGRSIIVRGLTALPVTFSPTSSTPRNTSADPASGDTQWTSPTPGTPSTRSRRTPKRRARDSGKQGRSSLWNFLTAWRRGR
jgi:cytochrome P450